MVVLLRAKQDYVVKYIIWYRTGHADLHDARPYAPHQESWLKDLQWRHQPLVEVKATVMEHSERP